MTTQKEEVITAAEALKRIGLEELIASDGWYSSSFVGWSGYPRPFPCGHADVYGFGPLKKDAGYPEETENDAMGSGRLYQQKVRVNQYHCSGEVLFSFPAYGVDASGRYYRINSSMVVSIDKVPDSNSTCLKVCFTT